MRSQSNTWVARHTLSGNRCRHVTTCDTCAVPANQGWRGRKGSLVITHNLKCRDGIESELPVVVADLKRFRVYFLLCVCVKRYRVYFLLLKRYLCVKRYRVYFLLLKRYRVPFPEDAWRSTWGQVRLKTVKWQSPEWQDWIRTGHGSHWCIQYGVA